MVIDIDSLVVPGVYPPEVIGTGGYIAPEVLLMVPVSKKSKGLYGTVNMLVKCVFYSAVESDVIRDNPAECINPRGGKVKKKRLRLQINR